MDLQLFTVLYLQNFSLGHDSEELLKIFLFVDFFVDHIYKIFERMKAKIKYLGAILFDMILAGT